MLIPYELDVPFDREPWMNWLLVGSIVVVFGLQMAWWIQTPASGDLALSPFGPYILREFSLKGLFGHLWLHVDIFHVVGNMIFLWLFGNAVCQKIGNLIFLPIYLFLGLAAATTSLLLAPHPEHGAIGASGAINGIVGMYLVLYPRNDISVFYWWFLVVKGTFEISGYWMILMWLAFDILGAIHGEGNVGYFAHLGGFFTGAALAVVMLLTKRVVMDQKFEESLMDLIREAMQRKPVPKPDMQNITVGDDDVSAPYPQNMYKAREIDIVGQIPLRTDGSHERQIQGEDFVPKQTSNQSGTLQFKWEKPAPRPGGLIRYRCGCGKRFKSHPALAGRSGICPQCNQVIVIPDGPIR